MLVVPWIRTAFGFAGCFEQIVFGAAIHAAHFLGKDDAENRSVTMVKRWHAKGFFVRQCTRIQQGCAAAQGATGGTAFEKRDDQRQQRQCDSDQDRIEEKVRFGLFVKNQKHRHGRHSANYAEHVRYSPKCSDIKRPSIRHRTRSCGLEFYGINGGHLLFANDSGHRFRKFDYRQVLDQKNLEFLWSITLLLSS